ncbi:MAG: hypothetical protein ACRDRN_19855 [Sciscionella sp.]
MWQVLLSIAGVVCGLTAHGRHSWERNAPHLVMALAMLGMATDLAAIGPTVWFVALVGTAAWFWRTAQPLAVRVRAAYDLVGMACLALAMPMPAGVLPALLLATWLAGKLALLTWASRLTPTRVRPLEQLGEVAMAGAMGLMVL